MFALFILAGLVGCASSENEKASRKRNPAACPLALVLEDAARQVTFAEGTPNGSATADKVAWTAEIRDVTLDCRYFGDVPIEANLSLDFAFGRGPAANGTERQYKYFVAVTRKDQEVIAKKNYAKIIEFGKDSSVETFSTKIDDIVIPRANENIAGSNFEIIVGMILTSDEARFNRSGKSLKFPSL